MSDSVVFEATENNERGATAVVEPWYGLRNRWFGREGIRSIPFEKNLAPVSGDVQHVA